MRHAPLVALLLLPALAGCLEPSEERCRELAALEPAGNLPVHALLQLDDDAMARRMADAVGDPLTGVRKEHREGPIQGSRHETGHGNVSIDRVRHSADRVDLSLTYTTGAAWTPWDGSTLEEDLRALHDAPGLDVELRLRERGERDGLTWLGLDQVVGGRPTDAGLGVTIALGDVWVDLQTGATTEHVLYDAHCE